MTPLIRTYSGLLVNPLDLKPEDIKIRDIGHHLACCNRFCGGVSEPINVASHSVLVMRIVKFDTEDRTTLLQALLHDASEAYLGDVTKWLKQSDAMLAYREAEERAQNTIFEKFGLPTECPDIIEHADRIAVTYEGQRGFNDQGWPFYPEKYPPLTARDLASIGNHNPFIGWWSSKHLFLDEFRAIWESLGEEEDDE